MKLQPTTVELQALLPQAPDAEAAVISGFFYRPDDVGNICLQIKITPQHFQLHGHRVLFSVVMDLWLNSSAINLVSVTEKLRTDKTLDTIGGSYFVSSVASYDSLGFHLTSFVELLQEKFVLREIHRISSEFRESSLDWPGGAAELLLSFQKATEGICVQKKGTSKTFKTLILEAVESIANGDEGTADILSGLENLDRLVKMRRGNFIVISGEAKGGKTALAGTIATNAAVHQEKRVAIVSLEMTDLEMVKRMIANSGRVNLAMVGRVPSELESQNIHRGACALANADVEIDCSSFDLPAISTVLRKFHAKKPLDLVVLDYIQLVEHTTGRKGETRQEIVAQISRTCKRLAGEMNCVLIGLSQLNEDGKLRESRAIGQDANAIIAVESTDEGTKTIRVVAQRSGPSNEEADVQWLPQFTRFENKI